MTGSPTELEALLWLAVDILGRMALRKRRRMWKHEILQLEDELFGVLERLSDLKPENPSEGEDVKRDA